MGLKFKVEKLEDVDEKFRDQYVQVDKEDATKGFQLAVDDLPQPEDTSALKNALERERARADKAMEEAKAKGLDVEAIRKDSEARLKALNEQIETVAKEGKKALRDKTALELATKLAGDSAELLLPHIKSRLRWADEDGKTIIRVLGTDGKASVASLTDLEAEFRGNKAFAPVIRAGHASGSGASQGTPGAGGAGSFKDPIRTPSDAKRFLQQRGIL